MMLEIPFYLIASAGMAIIVTQSSLFKPLRDYFDIGEVRRQEIKVYREAKYPKSTTQEKIKEFFYGLLSCSLCFGFWSGLFMWYFKPEMFAFACAGAIVSLFIYSKLD